MLYNELNGGIFLLPQVKRSPVGCDNDFYIMGEYHSAHTLHHEFTHHLESLAGERELVKEDERFLEDYMRRKSRK